MARFQPGLPVADVVGLLWVLEEAPSVIVSKDMTRKLAGDG